MSECLHVSSDDARPRRGSGWKDLASLIGRGVLAPRLIPAFRIEAFGKAIKQWCRSAAWNGAAEGLGGESSLEPRRNTT